MTENVELDRVQKNNRRIWIDVLIIISLLFLFPIGLILIWSATKWQKNVKLVITFLGILFFGVLYYFTGTMSIFNQYKPSNFSKEVTTKDWQGMNTELGELENKLYQPPANKYDSPFSNFILMAMNMKLLDPNITFNFKQETPQIIKQNFDIFKNEYELDQDYCRNSSGDVGNFPFVYAMAIKIVDNKIDLALNDKDWQIINKKINCEKDSPSYDLSIALITAKIIDPNFNFVLNEEIEKNIELFKDVSFFGGYLFTIPNYERLAYMKVLYPNHQLDLNQKDWNGMKKALDEYRTYDWKSFSQLAFIMKILAAKKINITEKGLEIISL